MSADAVPPLAARRALVLLPMLYVVHFATAGIHLPLLAPALLSLGLTPGFIGTVLALRALAGMLSPPLWGGLADVLGGTRGLVALSALLAGACFLGLALTADPTLVVLLNVGYGLAGVATTPLIDGAVLTALGEDRRRYGPIRAFGTVGFGVTALGASVLIGRGLLAGTPRVVFGAAAVLAACTAVLALFVPNLPRPRLTRGGQLAALWRSPRLGLLALLAGVHWGSHAAHTGFLIPLAKAAGFGTDVAGVAIAAGIVVEVFAMRLAAPLLERYDGRTLLVFISLTTIVRWAGLAMGPDLWGFWALHALHGISFGLFYPILIPLVASSVDGTVRQSAQGLMGTAFAIGGMLGTFAAGWVFERSGVASTWLTMAGIAALALLVVLALPRALGVPQPVAE